MNIFTEQPLDSLPIANVYKSINSAFKQQIERRQWMYKLGGVKDFVSNYPPIDRYMGLEIEVENVRFLNDAHDEIFRHAMETDSPLSAAFFKAVDDGSLRNNGIEFVSKVGLTGQEIIAGTDLLLSKEKLFRYKLDTSFRTSIHVHMNVLDLNYLQLKRLYLWYLFLEPLFFQLSGKRYTNIFCLPVTHTYHNFWAFAKAQDATQFDQRIGRCKKYCAFNLLPVSKAGTVEFRHHIGTNNVDTITNWMVFLYQFFEAAVSSKTEKLNDTFNFIFNHWQNNTLNVYIQETFGIAFDDEHFMNEHIKNVFSKLINYQDYLAKDMTDEEEPTEKRVAKTKKSSFTIPEELLAEWTATPTQPSNPVPSVQFVSGNISNQILDGLVLGIPPTNTWHATQTPEGDIIMFDESESIQVTNTNNF